jgi:hypothetical protein
MDIAVPVAVQCHGVDFSDVPWRSPGYVDWGLCHNAPCAGRMGYVFEMGVTGERCGCGHVFVSVGCVVPRVLFKKAVGKAAWRTS